MEDSSQEQETSLLQDIDMEKDDDKKRDEGSWTPTRTRRNRKKNKRDQEKQRESLSPYQFSVTFLDPVSGKKDTLAETTLSPLIEQSRMRDQPTPSRQRRLYADLRESEGESIAEGKKQKRRRKRTGRKLKREQSKDDLESLFRVPECSPTRLSEISEIPVEETTTDEDYLCLVARTALILPFSWKSGPTNPNRTVMQWLHKLRDQKYIDDNNQSVPVWEVKERLPSEVMDFTPQFRQVVGWRESQREKCSYQTWTCQRLTCNSHVIQNLFSTARLCTIQGECDNVNYEAEIEGVELLVYPMGSAILVFHVNWLPSNRRPDKFTLDDARSVLFASKFRHKVQGLCMGWNFYDENCQYQYLQGESEHNNHLKCLGSDLVQAKYNPEKTVSLTTVGNWLLHLNDEDPNSPIALLDYTRHAYHHTTIVVNREPPADVLQEYLYHLRRAFGQKNRPPPNPEVSLGSILTQRLNRYTGISREGTVCVSWPIDLEDPNDFELTKWHRKFQGVYLILALHVHGERCVLFELGDLAAGEAENLRLVTTETSDFNEMKQYRQRLRELAALMVRYTLSMSSNDCGGSSEFTEFFTTLRRVFGIPELRAELSSELKDVLAVVESNYLEEERRQRDEAEADRRKNREFQAEHKALREQHEQQFNLILGVLGSFTLPFVVVSGVFGMNLYNLPESVDFWWLIGITMVASILLLAGIIYWRKESKRKWHRSMMEIKLKLGRSDNDTPMTL